ncbi:Linker histone H1 and H5 family protein [Monocercomonoides exilis]|uniref:Linker histone H1 and H5 family protein n=1 Tax=Monocercomonoides exilis TaxID=2049356 RepID=UPI00355ABB23|nr:Linker histone H1 and H5 family protein [Monocercomonoides exilis]|eukprot:MONOS_1153.1-p1 / transcript=MONOS_1153.1 / gene=MONOS_1153 / organism=Monocercomonoides_exilis_PA203 / gene_product=Linker histone H1 and H5 family protein / transcript_product=Linker histone H1 and H5 family protein / location=Mono_scaffold00019:197667-198215(-) / protein_length=183 / sequence_SO=supercontig / SO=protein_coding / is_pseudo=false
MSDTETTTQAAPKVKQTKPKNKKSTPSIPVRKYIIEAIGKLKDRTGSSTIAIGNEIIRAHKDMDVNVVFLANQLKIQLRRMVAEGLLKKHKASYLLTDKTKKMNKVTEKKLMKKSSKKPKKDKKKKTSKVVKKSNKKSAKPKKAKKQIKKISKDKKKKITSKPKTKKAKRPTNKKNTSKKSA